MIEYISGQIVDLMPTSVILECNGIGYFLNISLTTYSALSSKNSSKLYVRFTYSNVPFRRYEKVMNKKIELFTVK